MPTIDRRTFLKHTTLAASAATALTAGMPMSAAGANDRVIIGFMGTGGRGQFLAAEFATRSDVEIRYCADPDKNRAEQCADALEKATGKRPIVTQDFRNILDDKEVDGIVNATPDHWHAPGTIFACMAGKDVYVEKPTSHSIWESQKMVEYARKTGRIVQVGAQNRSNEYVYAAFDYIRTPEFGKVHFVRVLNSKLRSPVPEAPDSEPPAGVDYSMWLGPAPMRPFNVSHFHYNWHWFWDYSGGDIINDGVHQIDIARWLIDRDYPKAVVSAGGIHFYKDVQETPDTHTVNWEYDGLTMVFEQTLWSPYMKKMPMDVRDQDTLPLWPFSGTRMEIYGENQMMFFERHGGGWQVFDAEGQSVKIYHGKFSPSNTAHIENYISCIRSRELPTADIEKLHKSTLLCHYGNIAYRTGRKLHIDPVTECFVNDDEANGLVKRTYRDPWVIPDTA
ncbi:MAG: dehydrogenase [Candidatus Hydrogenedentota bacterium]